MRNLGLIISFWLAAISLTTNALALGLGEIEVNSFLNQPLKAEIEVISARPGEIDDLLVGLASRDAFTRAGLSRPSSLSELRFAVNKSEEGDSAVVLITTKAAIKEPFLNFLVEADWSKGRVLREFTILLDPPFYADSPAPQPEPEPAAKTTEPAEPTLQPVAEPGESTAVSDSEASEVSKPIALSEPTSTSVEQTNQDASDITEVLEMVESADTDTKADTGPGTDDIKIVRGDTLWGISSNLQGAGHSMNQIMLAIQRANPNAFTNNNINNMKVGAVLRIPDANEFGEIDQQQAYAQVLEQNGLWDDYVARVTGVPAVSTETAETNTATGTQAQETESSGELNLLTPGDGESDAAGLQNEGEDVNELRVKLALAEEELDASRIENQEQESRIAELEARLSKFEELQKMVEIEDDSLAQLQSNQAQDSELSEEQPVISETINQQQQLDDQDALLDEVLGEDDATETMTDDSPIASDSDTMAEDTIPEFTIEEVVETTEPDVMVEEESSAPPVPVIITEIESEPSILDGIIPDAILDMLPGMGDAMPSGDSLAFDPVMLGGLGGIILLLIGLVVYRRQKSADSHDGDILINDPIFASDGEDDDLTPIHMADDTFEGLEDDSELSLPDEHLLFDDLEGGKEEEVDDFVQTAIVSKDDLQELEEAPQTSATEEQDDILNEADVYLAYNLYDNAVELLTQSLEANPERADYRSKLLDTHFATKNAEAFIREAEALKSMGDAASRYWDRVQVMGYELAPDNAMFADAKDSNLSAADLAILKPAEADFDLGSSASDTNFSIADFDLGEEDTSVLDISDSTTGELDLVGAPEPQELFDIDETADSDDTNITEIIDTPEEVDNLDFSLDEVEDSVEESESEVDSVELDLPDDLDLSSDDSVQPTDILEVDTAVIDTSAFATELADAADDDDTNITEMIDTPEEIDNLDFSLDDVEDSVEESESEVDSVELDLSDDLDLSSDDNAQPTDVLEVDTAAVDTSAFAAKLADAADGDMGNIESTALIDLDGTVETDIVFSEADTETVLALGGDTEELNLDLDALDDDDSLTIDLELDGEVAKTGTFAPGDFDDLDDITGTADFDDIEDLMLPDDVDESSTKLDLARAFIDMGDAEGARSSLDEVLSEGNDEQKTEAQSLLDQL